MQVTMTSEFFISIISYILHFKYLNNTAATAQYLAQLNLSESDIIMVQKDPYYGWDSPYSTKIWVQAYLDYNSSQNIGSGGNDVILNYFQIPELQSLVLANGTINNLINEILKEMKSAYGTTDPVELGCLQWSESSVTQNLSYYLPFISNSSYNSSFYFLNSTLGFIPEIGFDQKFIFNSSVLNYTQYASSLLQVEYSYPNTNRGSLINVQNLEEFLIGMQNEEDFPALVKQ